jgi:hypothetical protein|tara:strand:- start:1629 stop:1856 length:228 start_codon:yes stop_codon:yes gene_type:complete
MGVFGVIVAVLLILLMFLAAFRVYDEIKYSWKMKQELNNNNATCYFERGWFNLPLAKVCTYNNTIILEKEPNARD